MIDVRLCTGPQLRLGEGVRWDARRDELLHVDIEAGVLYRSRIAADGDLTPVAAIGIGETVGFVAPVAGRDVWVVGAGQGIRLVRADGTVEPVLDLSGPGTRMNDGACDPSGRLWAGSMALDHRPGAGALHRIDPDGTATVVLDGLTIPNGLGWSPDAATMYAIDSGARAVWAFDADAESGEIANRRTLIELEDGVAPDGLTLDASGDLWVAVFGAGQVRRHAPDGRLRDTIAVPAPQTTGCALGGPRLRTLYVTTATEGYDDARRAAEPGSGRVYRCEVDAIGVPAAAFRPLGDWLPQ